MIQPGPDDLTALRPRLRSKNLLITIAYNYSDVIGQQIPLVKKHVRDCIHVIADNSSNPVAAGTIRDLAGSHGSQYVRIPSFEWESPNASHSHALNWTWRNVIRPAGPAAFGFIDHDIFPVRATDPFAPLAGYPVAGRVWDGQFDGRWHLWAGFCFFRTDYVSGRRLNFALDFYGGLDTGGRNWKPLYRHLDRDAPIRVSGARKSDTMVWNSEFNGSGTGCIGAATGTSSSARGQRKTAGSPTISPAWQADLRLVTGACGRSPSRCRRLSFVGRLPERGEREPGALVERGKSRIDGFARQQRRPGLFDPHGMERQRQQGCDRHDHDVEGAARPERYVHCAP
jgi:hypothetical protein